MSKMKPVVFDSVWDAIHALEEAAVMKLKVKLFEALRSHLDQLDMSQTAIAKKCKCSQSQVSDIVRGKISNFSLDRLVKTLHSLGVVVDMTIQK